LQCLINTAKQKKTEGKEANLSLALATLKNRRGAEFIPSVGVKDAKPTLVWTKSPTRHACFKTRSD